MPPARAATANRRHEIAMHTSDLANVSTVSEAPFRTVAILGLGLLGGSLGLALKRTTPAPCVLACARRAESIEDAVRLGAVDRGATDPAEILPHADLTVICTPVSTIVSMLHAYRSHWRPGSVVTDVGSVKGGIMRAAAHEFKDLDVTFIGSHPMAGSDRSGLRYAKGNLYDGATVFMTAPPAAGDTAVAALERLWQICGARTVQIDGDDHDALVARTSHLPHLLAAAAVDVGLSPPQAVLGTAGAFRDVTRIAGSSPEMWRQICELNRTELLRALDECMTQLADIRSFLANSEWEAVQDYLSRAREKRRAWESDWHRIKGEKP